MTADLTSADARSLPRADGPTQSRNRRPMLHYVIGNCLALLAGLVVAYVALLRGGHITSLTIRTGDFVQYFGISQLIIKGHGGAIYDFQRLSHVEELIVYPLSVQHGVLPYLYPPYFAIVVAPLSMLDYGAAYALWLIVNCVLLVSTLFALERYAGLGGRTAALVRLAGICSLPVVMTLALGQVSIVILALLASALLAARARRHELAGAALALALIKPPYVVPFLIIFIVQRRWRTIAAFGATGVGLLLLPIPVLGLSINRVYADLLIAVNQWQGKGGAVVYHHVTIAAATYDPHVNQGIYGFSQLLLASGPARLSALGLTLLFVAVLVWSAWRSRAIDLPFALAAVVALLINPHVLVHDLTLLLIPVCVALRYRGSRSLWLGFLLAALYAVITVGYPLSYAVPVQLSAIGMAVLTGWLVMASQRGNESTPEPGNRKPARRMLLGTSPNA